MEAHPRHRFEVKKSFRLEEPNRYLPMLAILVSSFLVENNVTHAFFFSDDSDDERTRLRRARIGARIARGVPREFLTDSVNTGPSTDTGQISELSKSKEVFKSWL